MLTIATSFLSRYWSQLVSALLLGLLVWYIMSLRMDNANLSRTNELLSTKLDTVYKEIEANKAEYEANLKVYQSKEKKVETRYKKIYETIYVWEDNNVSCEDAMSRFDSTVY